MLLVPERGKVSHHSQAFAHIGESVQSIGIDLECTTKETDTQHDAHRLNARFQDFLLAVPHRSTKCKSLTLRTTNALGNLSDPLFQQFPWAQWIPYGDVAHSLNIL